MTMSFRGLRWMAAGLLVVASAASSAAVTHRLVPAEQHRGVPPRIKRDRFMIEPSVTSVTLSPDGRHVAWLRRQGSDNGLWLTSTDRIAPQRLVRRIDAERLHWSHDGRWLFLTDARKVRAVSIDGAPGAGILATFDQRQFWRVIGADPWQPAALLMLENLHRFGKRDPIGSRLWRVTPGGGRTLVAFARRPVVDVEVRRDGHVAFAKLVDGARHLIVGRLGDGRYHVIARCERLRRCDPLSTDEDGRTLWLSGDLDGDLQGVMRMRAYGRIDRVCTDPAGVADVDAVAIDPGSGRPVVAAYGGPVPSLVGLTPAAMAVLRQLHQRLPRGQHRVQPSGGDIWLIEERGARLQGNRWHLFDTKTGRLRTLIDDPGPMARIASRDLAPVAPITLKASDGMLLHGLLTLPPGRDPALSPLVVLVHGGPWSRDTIDYSAQTQLLANRGYIVFRPQYRGSSGYGRRYLFAARGDFGNGRVQRDIEDGTRWLLAHGVGDRRRVAIVGASYGGYGVLQAVSDGSDLYRVGFAAVPPPDFGRAIIRMAHKGVGGEYQGIGFASRLRALALDPADAVKMERLSRQAPAERVARLFAPLTIVAAERDDRVALRDVLDYAARARIAGKPVEVIVARGQPHSPDDILPRRAMLYLLEDALARDLDMRRADPPISPVRRWMAAKLRHAEPRRPDRSL